MAANTPQVVVACAWYNRADYIHDTVDSLLAQDFDSFEIVVVNDGSPDHRVREILDSYADPRLRVIHQENTGFVRAIRRAIDRSDAPYIAIQGAGDMSYPQRLRKQFEKLRSNDSLGAVGAWYVNVAVGLDGCSKVVNKVQLKGKVDRETLIKRNAFSHGEVMFSRKAYESCGGYREFFENAQDRDLWLRMSENYSFQIIPEELYERRLFSGSGVSSNAKKRILQAGLANIAVECAKLKDKTGIDIVSVLGDSAKLLRKRSSNVAKQAAKAGLIALINGDEASAKMYLTLARREKITLFVLTSSLILLLCSVLGERWLKLIIEYIPKKLSKKVERYSS